MSSVQIEPANPVIPQFHLMDVFSFRVSFILRDLYFKYLWEVAWSLQGTRYEEAAWQLIWLRHVLNFLFSLIDIFVAAEQRSNVDTL